MMRMSSVCRVGMPGELVADDRLRPGQHKAEIEMTSGSQRAVDDAARGVVAAHRVYGDSHHQVGSGLRLERLLSLTEPLYASSTARTWRPR